MKRVRPLIFDLLMRPKIPTISFFLSSFARLSVRICTSFFQRKKEKGCEPVGNLDLARKGTSSSFHEQVVIVILDKGFYIEIISTSNANYLYESALRFVKGRKKQGVNPWEILT